MDNLMSCPFCKSTNVSYETDILEGYSFGNVECGDCGASGGCFDLYLPAPKDDYCNDYERKLDPECKSKAVKAWNTRT